MAGMSATFMAKPLNDGQPGSSCHVHLSMVDERAAPVFWEEEATHRISAIMEHSIAGVLQRIPDFMAWYAPTVNSYRRTNAGDVAGWGRTWGLDNRTTSVRVVGHRAADLRLEFRIPGADTNPYLTLAALIASVRDGIEEQRRPPVMTAGNGYETERDPGFAQHLGAATDALRASSFARAEMGADVVDHFCDLWAHEWSSFLGTVADWDLRRYFDRI
jgi:glutamine synthetase